MSYLLQFADELMTTQFSVLSEMYNEAERRLNEGHERYQVIMGIIDQVADKRLHERTGVPGGWYYTPLR